jgi:hypothetical protein
MSHTTTAAEMIVTLYRDIARGELRTVCVENMVLVPTDDIETWIRRHTTRPDEPNDEDMTAPYAHSGERV